jgi:hypothetical protein
MNRRSGKDEIRGRVTWRTATAAVIAAAALTGAAVLGFLLAGRGGGLARADLVLPMIPAGIAAVGSVDADAVLRTPERLAHLRALAGIEEGRAEALSARFALRADRVRRVFFFVRESAPGGGILEGDLRGGDLTGTADGQHLGVEVRRAGSLWAAPLGGGRAAVGSREAVVAVLDAARAGARALPAEPRFSALRELAVEGRGRSTLELVILRAEGLARAWPPAGRARALGLFLKADGDEAEMLGLYAGEPAALGTAEADLRARAPRDRLLAGATIERREGLVRVRVKGKIEDIVRRATWLAGGALSRLAPR